MVMKMQGMVLTVAVLVEIPMVLGVMMMTLLKVRAGHDDAGSCDLTALRIQKPVVSWEVVMSFVEVAPEGVFQHSNNSVMTIHPIVHCHRNHEAALEASAHRGRLLPPPQ